MRKKFIKYTYQTILCILPLILLSSCKTTKTAMPIDPVITRTPTTQDSVVQFRQDAYHSVAPGETLWRIAKMYAVDIDSLKSVNNIRNVRDIDIGRKLLIPKGTSRKNVVTLYPSKKWKYIIIHHSASDEGNAERINQAHLNRGWKGAGYHFIIDNGTCGKDDGQIEITPRWIKQLNGAHCKANGMNFNGIGICLIGNFSNPGEPVSTKQMNSLLFLTKRLKEYYDIPEWKILRHGEVKHAKTECPGTYFPWERFKSKL